MINIGQYIEMAINWMMVHFSTFFDAVNAGIGSFIIGFQHVLFGIPFYITILVLAALAWMKAGRGTAIFTALGLLLIYGLGGIQIDEKHPGFKHILLKPFFPADMNELTIRYNTPYGWLNINWVRQTNDCIRYTIDIPAGTSATFVPFTMPEPQKSITLQAGKHSLELDFIHQLINQR